MSASHSPSLHGQAYPLSITSSFAFVQGIMECYVPTFGHTALRCAELSKAEARLQMLPATIFLVGALCVALNWTRLALARRLFRFEHFLGLLMFGLLSFSLACADYSNAVSLQPFGSSRTIGSLSVVPTALMILTVYQFLPPHAALPAWLDRGMAATAFGSLVTKIVASIGAYTPDGVVKEIRNDFYASGACMVGFLLCSLVASQNSRFFAIPIGQGGSFEAFISLGRSANILFGFALIALLAQACFAFVIAPTYALIITSSLLGALAYCLLVATSIASHWNTSLHQKKTKMDSGRDREKGKRQEEFFHITDDNGVNVWRNNAVAEQVGPHEHHAVPSSHFLDGAVPDEHKAHADASHHRRAANAVQSPRHESERGSVIWNGGAIDRRVNTQSGVSAASWDRLEQIMKGRQERSRIMHARPQSGMTNYGSEASFAQVAEGVNTRPGSMLSSAGLAAILGMGSSSIPPVPPIHPKYLTSIRANRVSGHEGGDVLTYAKPLTAGDEPIPLSTSLKAEARPTGKSSQQARTLPALSDLLWSGRNKSAKQSDPSTVKSTRIGKTPNGTIDSTIGKSSVVTSTDKVSLDENSSLAARYSSRKLFPFTMLTEAPSDVPQTADDVSSRQRNDERHCSTASSRASIPLPPHTSMSLPCDVNVASPWHRSIASSTNQESGHFAQLQDALLKRIASPEMAKATSPLKFSTASIQRQSSLKFASDGSRRAIALLREEQQACATEQNSLAPEPSSPDSDVQKETQHEQAEKPNDEIDRSEKDVLKSIPLTPTKVNRGKVIRKVDVQEDQSTRMASTLRFPSTPT